MPTRSLSSRDRLALLLVVVGIAALVAGVAFVYWPAALMILGVTLLVAAYVVRYLEVQSATS